MNDAVFLRRAIALASEARKAGEMPYAAVLVYNGEIVYEGLDRTLSSTDPTQHAELRLISDYCRQQQRFGLSGHILYASTEPCPMCAWAAYWSKISRIVFSVTQEMLQGLSGGRPKPSAGSTLPAYHEIEIVGPLLPDEGLSVFEGYTFIRKSDRDNLHQNP